MPYYYRCSFFCSDMGHKRDNILSHSLFTICKMGIQKKAVPAIDKKTNLKMTFCYLLKTDNFTGRLPLCPSFFATHVLWVLTTDYSFALHFQVLIISLSTIKITYAFYIKIRLVEENSIIQLLNRTNIIDSVSKCTLTCCP